MQWDYTWKGTIQLQNTAQGFYPYKLPTIKQKINNNNCHHTWAFCTVTSFSSQQAAKAAKLHAYKKHIWLWEIQNATTCLGAVLWLLATWCWNVTPFSAGLSGKPKTACAVTWLVSTSGCGFYRYSAALRPADLLRAPLATRRTVLPCPGSERIY